MRRWLARQLGYGGIEWPRSKLLDLPILLVNVNQVPQLRTKQGFISTMNYPGGVQPVVGEIGAVTAGRVVLEECIEKLVL